jgi:AraC family transcriptional regulator
MSDTVYIDQILYVRETIRIRNMLCDCCKSVVKDILKANHGIVEEIELGKATVLLEDGKINREDLRKLLEKAGLGIIETREEIVVENIKQAVIDLIHRMNNVSSIVRKSDYLVEKLGMSYQHLSRVFSKYQPITLEKYIILNKIERIKELIDQGEFSLSEIAYMMDYSSVHYLSTQFRRYTGYSVTDYKAGKGGKVPVNALR